MTSIDKKNLVYRQKVAGVVLNDKNEILLLNLQSYDDKNWTIVGGGIDEGETPEQAMIREFKEEVGTDKVEILKKSEVVNQYEFPDSVIQKHLDKGNNYRGQQATQFVCKFTGTDEDIQVQKEEVRKYQWVDPKDLKDYLHFEGQLENVEEILKNYNN